MIFIFRHNEILVEMTPPPPVQAVAAASDVKDDDSKWTAGLTTEGMFDF